MRIKEEKERGFPTYRRGEHAPANYLEADNDDDGGLMLFAIIEF